MTSFLFTNNSILYIIVIGEIVKKYLIGIIIILLIISIIFIFFLKKDSIIGKWKAVDLEYELYYLFNEDNTCSYEMVGAKLDCTYEIKDDELIILYKGNAQEYTFKYTLKDNKLIIKDNTGKDNKFLRQEKKDE